jgi:hypothetical protein
MIEETFRKADAYFKRMVVFIFLGVGVIYGVRYIDEPVTSGETIWGEVISTAPTPTGYRHLTATTRANILLDNGKSIYTEIGGATPGQRVEFKITRTRVSRRESYKWVPSR